MQYSIEQFVVPIKEINELTMKSIEKVSAIQLKVMQENAKASIEALKASASIKDLDTLNTYMQAQMNSAQSIYAKSVKDSEKIAKMAESYATDVKALVEKSMAV